MRKIPKNLENPIDNYLLDICEYVSPTFYKYGFTPNLITTLSNITTIIVVLLLLQAQYTWAAFLVLVAYFFDCLDGHVARKYNMTSDFGDYYDHISDVIKVIAVVYTMYYIDSRKLLIVLPFLILAFILMMVHLGCQEQYYDSDESKSLSMMKNLCPIDINNTDSIENKLSYTKYFGSGTANLVLIVAILYYNF
jgi:hypothetical protein